MTSVKIKIQITGSENQIDEIEIGKIDQIMILHNTNVLEDAIVAKVVIKLREMLKVEISNIQADNRKRAGDITRKLFGNAD